MKQKPTLHDFDAHGRPVLNQEHLEQELEKALAENERLKRVVLLQQRRWRQHFPETENAKPTLH